MTDPNPTLPASEQHDALRARLIALADEMRAHADADSGASRTHRLILQWAHGLETIAAWNTRASLPTGEGDAVAWELVGYEYQHDETGRTTFVELQQVEWGWVKNNERWTQASPCYRPTTARNLGATYYAAPPAALPVAALRELAVSIRARASRGEVTPQMIADELTALAPAGGELTGAMPAQASAWLAVTELLHEVAPTWINGEGTGVELALAAIRQLAALPAAGNAGVDDLVNAIMRHPFGDTTLGNIICAEIAGERLRLELAAALTAALPAAGNAGVDDAAVERACAAYYTEAGWANYQPEDDRPDARKWMRAALTAALAHAAPAVGVDGVVAHESAASDVVTHEAADGESQAPAEPRAAGDGIPEIRKVAKRNLRSLIERSNDSEKALMLACLKELS